MKPEYDWLILIVMHDFEEAEFERIIQMILDEFTSEGITDKNKVLLIHDKVQIDDEKKVHFKTFFQTLILKSDNSDDPLEFNFVDIHEAEVGFKFNDQRGWECLLTWINKKYESDRTILITLSHGAGVGIKGPESNERKFDVLNSPNRIIPIEYLHQETRKYLMQQRENLKYQLIDKYLITQVNREDEICKKMEMLWMTELACALKNSFGKRKIDILMMANCYMQTFETGWLLRKQVKYLVAPETVFKAYGYSFSGLLYVVNRRPEIKTRDLVKTIIPDFVLKMKDDRIESKHMKMVSVFINDLRYYGVLKFLFERISGILMKCSDKKLGQVIEHRQKIQNSSDYPLNDRCKPESDPTKYEFIDLNHFLSRMNIVFRYNLFFRFFTFLFKRISARSTVQIYIGEDYITHDLFINRKFRLKGISIFMPKNLTTSRNSEIINCAYFGTSEISIAEGPVIPLELFVKTSSWDEFIKKYITKLTTTKHDN